MADNNSTTSPERLQDLVGEFSLKIIIWIIAVLNLVAATYGVASWCIVKKFRHFRNYVVLSAVISKTIYEFSIHVINPLTEKLIQNLILVLLKEVYETYLVVSRHYWLNVLCYIFYVDFVKVFRLDIHRRYLKSSLFAWGVPLISISLLIVPALYIFIFVSRTRSVYDILLVFNVLIMLMPVVINFGIYITVLCSIYRISEAGVSTTFNKWRRFYIASLIFVLSNGITLPLIVIPFDVYITSTIVIIMEIGAMLNNAGLPVYLMILKSNRELWREFLDKRSKQNSFEMK